MADTEGATKTYRNIIGKARTIRTAVMVVEYLRTRCAAPFSSVHPDSIQYRFQNPDEQNGFWSAEIFVVTYGQQLDPNLSTRFVNDCRAFVAGAGEVWA